VHYTDGIGFALKRPLPGGRQSFSPDVAFHTGPRPQHRMRFVDGAPAFAVEVQSENDYGSAAEANLSAKRADYFEAGTLVVWDVDPVAKQCRFIVATRTRRRRCTARESTQTPSRPFSGGGWPSIISSRAVFLDRH
jgi:hypothetical protein